MQSEKHRFVKSMTQNAEQLFNEKVSSTVSFMLERN